MIPNLKPLIEPLTTRFPAAWAKAQKPHDDGEFNARVCAVLHYEHGLTQVGRNGKRGDPKNLSRDVINWRGEGPNFDPTDGNTPCTIIDFIEKHETGDAKIIQITPDPNGPGAWVKPLTLAQIDAGTPPTPPPAPVFPSYEAIGGDAFYRAMVGVPLQADYLMAGQALNDGSAVWFSRTIYSVIEAMVKANGQPIDTAAIVRKFRNEWRFILGLPPV